MRPTRRRGPIASCPRWGWGAEASRLWVRKYLSAIQYHRISKRDTNFTNPHEFGYESPGTEQVGRVTPCALPSVNHATESACRGLPALPDLICYAAAPGV